MAGRTGTIRRRMRGTAAQDRCRAKTGTLIGVSALAGLCDSAGGHTIAFAMLMNRANVSRAHGVQDRVAAAIARYDGARERPVGVEDVGRRRARPARWRDRRDGAAARTT